MEKEIKGTVVSAVRQWWLKVNTKAIRLSALDGAVFPYVIKVNYAVGGVEYQKRKWISAGAPVPAVGSSVTVIYHEEDPKKAGIVL